MRAKTTTAEIASRQFGCVDRQQLLDIGLSAAAIGRRIKSGQLIPQYRGVYRVGHAAPSTEATYMAAVLAAGDGTVLAGRAAAHLSRLLKGAAPRPEVLTTRNIRIKGVRVRRTRALDRRDVTNHRGIPITTVARTLVDLASELPEAALARACHEAMVLHRTQPEDVEAVLERNSNAKGAAALRRILRGDIRLTLSKLESRFLQILAENDLELPEANKQVSGRFVDCRWPKRRLTVELDGYRYHSSRHAWEQDRKRERQARARGDDFRRYTSGDVFDDPQALLRELRPLLS